MTTPPSPQDSPAAQKKVNTKKGLLVTETADTDSIIGSMPDSLRNALLVRYAEISSDCQAECDLLLKKFAKKDHHVLLEFQRELARKDQKGTIFKSSTATKSIDNNIQNQAIMLEYKKFWVDIAEGSEEKAKSVSAEDQAVLRKLASYVPKLVHRRLLQSPNTTTPALEHYPSAVVFADISGFTPLTEKLASMGAEGVERLTAQLNAYFDSLIGTIYRFGGDIVKFAGDAVLCVWPASSAKGLPGVILLACQCTKALLEELGNYKVEGTECILRLHIGVGAGEVGGVYVGGENNRVEYFISGQVLEQVSACEKQAQPGEAYVSAVAWMLVNGALQGSQGKEKSALANFKLEGIKTPVDVPPPVTLPLTKEMEDPLKTYSQPGVLRHIYSKTKRWLAELRRVSVIFVNLTAPFKESQLAELQTCIRSMQSIIFKYEGILRQFMIDDKGSVCIAGFGLPPYAHEDDAKRAVETAIEIYDVLTTNLRIPCSIGVTTGQVFCGDVGNESRKEYAMVGDVVNLSARLMAAAKQGILTDEPTYESCKNSQIHFAKQDPIRVKGKANPINVYIPSKKRRSDTANRARGAAAGTGVSASSDSIQFTKTIIGREKEIKKLRKIASRITTQKSDPHSHVLVIEGEEGVGKTRLAQECQVVFKEIVPEGRVFMGTGDQLKATIPYYPWRDIFEQCLNERGQLPEAFVKHWQADAELLPLLNAVLPLNLKEGPRITSMSSQMRSELTQSFLVKVLKYIVKRGSLLILENAHWLDSASWALALAAAKQLDGVLIVLAMRLMREGLPFQFSQILYLNKTKRLLLKTLTEEDTGQMIAMCLQIKKIPESIAKEIHQKSKGNPFLTEEIVFALRDNGGLQITKGGECMLTTDVEHAIPNSINALLTSKVDKLSPGQQVILKVASVIGQQFTADMLPEIIMAQSTNETSPVMIKPQELRKDLRAIEHLGLIAVETPDPELTFTFCNSLIKDVVYSLMLFSHRRMIHKNVVSFYTDKYAGNSSYYPLLAYHSKQAEDTEEALKYFKAAGNTALVAFANKEAVTFFTEALSLIAKLEQSGTSEGITTERKVGTAYYNLGQFNKAETHFRTSLELMGIPIPDENSKQKSPAVFKKLASHTFLPENGKKDKNKVELDKTEINFRKREAIMSLINMSKVCYYGANRSNTTLCTNLASQISEEAGGALCAEVYAVATLSASINGDFQVADSYLEKAREISGKHVDVVKTIEQMDGLHCCTRSQWDKAIECFTRSVEAAKTVGDLKSLEESYVFLGTVYFLKGDVRKSVELTKEAYESAFRRGDAHVQILASTANARNFYALGDWSKCTTILEDIELFESVGTSLVSTDINYFALKALIHLRRSELDRCWFYAETVFTMLSKYEPTVFMNYFGYSWLVEVYVRLMQEPEKLAVLTLNKSKIASKAKKALELLNKFAQVFNFAQVAVHMWKGSLQYLGDKKSKAESEFSKGIELAKSLGMAYDQALVLYQKGVLTESPNDIRGALNIFPDMSKRSVNLSQIRLNKKKYLLQSVDSSNFATNTISPSSSSSSMPVSPSTSGTLGKSQSKMNKSTSNTSPGTVASIINNINNNNLTVSNNNTGHQRTPSTSSSPGKQ